MHSMGKKWHRVAPLPDDLAQRLTQLPDLLATEGVDLAYLFGSVARHGQGNDVDLALWMQDEDKRPFRLRDTLTDFLGSQRLDIVDLRRASNTLRFEIISSGRLLYAASNQIRLDFELETVRIYHDREIPRRRQEERLRYRLSQWLSDDTREP